MITAVTEKVFTVKSPERGLFGGRPLEEAVKKTIPEPTGGTEYSGTFPALRVRAKVKVEPCMLMHPYVSSDT